MATRKTWYEMERDYPDEWLLISEMERDDLGRFKSGVVERHLKVKEKVYCKPALNKPTEFRYTGESTFSGFRSHVQNNVPV